MNKQPAMMLVKWRRGHTSVV